MTYSFPASYDGVCGAGCPNRIHPGDRVRYVGDRLVHDDCAPEPAPLEQLADAVCGVCWKTKPCRCDG